MSSNGSAASSLARDFRVRPAVVDDAESILRLIRGLAEYEKAPEEVLNTVEQLKEDGWGRTPRFTAFIAEVPDTDTASSNSSVSSTPATSTRTSWRAVAFALTYFAYSTWKGTCLYLEDIYVEPTHRTRGIGMTLIQHCVEYAATHNCQRVMWQALDWNQSAIDFYVKKLGATIMKEWLSLRLTKEGIDAFRQRYPNSSGSSSAASNGMSVQQKQQQQQVVSEDDMATLS